MDQRGLVVTKNVYFSLLTHTNQLLLVTLCHTPAGIENSKVGRDADTTVRTDRHEGLIVTRKYPLRGYILGVLTHTTAWDRHWGGDKTLKLVLV